MDKAVHAGTKSSGTISGGIIGLGTGLASISLIWRGHDGREVVLYLLEGELASHNCKGQGKNDPERKLGDASRQVAAEEDAR
jgi:hypothetical protein